MKKEFVTVGHWTLRCDDVSGVCIELASGKWWVTVIGRFGTLRCEETSWAAAMEMERQVLEAIGAMGNPLGGGQP